ncbi:Phage tail protein [compost metagenome]
MTEYIWLGGKSNVELGFLVLRSTNRPGLPGTVDRTLSIPGRNGMWDYGADMGARSFIIDCAFITQNSFELQNAVANLSAHLIDSYGKPRTLELKFRERPNQTFAVRFMGSLDVERIVGLGTFTIPLTAFDPFAYGPEQLQELSITSSPTIINIQSAGNVRTTPEIIITNQGANTLRSFKISNEYVIEG